MKKMIMFFAGLILMVLMFASLFFAGLIYDTGAKVDIDTYFFQPSNNPSERPGVPASPSDLGDDSMYDLLLQRYVTELFYVTPVSQSGDNVANDRPLLRNMSSAPVFDTWQRDIAPQIQELADAHALRTVRIVDTWTESENYTGVEYELQTWDEPNNFSLEPTLTRGIIYMDIFYATGMREMIAGRTPEQYLEDGGDPAAVFRFGVRDIVTQE